jgi:esterase/lipase superfamily enzyme
MNKDEINNLLLDYLSGINRNKALSNLSKERLIYLTGQREAIIDILEAIQKW